MSKILVVDDNRDIVMMLRMTFEAGGHEVLSTSDPFEAVPLMLQQVPDVLILDVMMPKRSGWDVLREVRQHSQIPSIPIVMLTALADVNDRVRGLRGGADDYQVKPFEPEEILARVEGLIARRGGLPLAPLIRTDPGDGAGQLEGTLAEIERRIASEKDLTDLSLGRYEVRKPLGRGAMGTVLEGWDPKLQRPVALKTLRLSVEPAPGKNRGRQASRLIQEAVTNARVNHPNIVTVYDVGEEGEAAFIAMEMVAGQSLDDRLDAYGALPYPYVIFIGISVARALVAAHQQGIVHRDIKPANVLLGNKGSVKVTDFGISELLTRTCAPGSIFGTPGYLAPESLTGSAITPSSDLFSLGVTLYECLAGFHPFAAENWRQTLSNTVSKRPRPIDQLLSGLPPSLVQVVGQMMEKEPADRPEKADIVVDLLEKLSFTEDIPIPADVNAAQEKRVRVSTTRSRMVTLETWSKTQEMDTASL